MLGSLLVFFVAEVDWHYVGAVNCFEVPTSKQVSVVIVLRVVFVVQIELDLTKSSESKQNTVCVRESFTAAALQTDLQS